ncbi:MAG: hypothetical protein M1831_006729 [Alyxoria varia]|nr:MAG: hypothetical protein M1831_006729 [Alyxoria varia]
MPFQRPHFRMSPRANEAAIVGGDIGQNYRFTILTEGLIRLEYTQNGMFEDRASTFAINRNIEVPPFRKVEDDQKLEIITKYYHLYYDRKPFSSNGLKVQVKGNITNWHSTWRFGYRHEEELFKLGATTRTLDRADGRIPLEPGVINRNGYAEIDDSDSMLFTEDGWIAPRRTDGSLGCDLYLFAYGHDYKSAIKALYTVSGSQPLLPRWALGNWWSRYYKYSDKEYLNLMDRFRREQVPLSVAVLDMDWHWVDDKRVRDHGFSGWTGYSWNTDLFPDPGGFVRDLHSRGLSVTACDHPADGVAAFEDSYDEMCKNMGRSSASKDPIPFDCTNLEFMKAYFEVLLRQREEEGVDFWWVDWQSGPFSDGQPGIDPLWVLNHFHFLLSAREDGRPITFSRYAGPGSHRYPVGFSGDAVITWESLKFQPEFTATSSNIGFGWWNHDIGGHMQGYRDDELQTRWVQLGVFSPLLRLHSTNNPWMSKEPWQFSPEAQHIQTEALRLRHRLIPYLHSMNYRAAAENEPLVQPIYWSYPNHDQAYNYKNVFFYGSELVVAPLTSPRDSTTLRSEVSLWLPLGKYVDIFTGSVYDGDRELTVFRKLEEYAVFAKEGSIIPFDGSETPPNGCPNPKALHVKVVAGATSSFDLWEDDGSGSDLNSANRIDTRMAFDQDEGIFSTFSAVVDPNVLSGYRDWAFAFVAVNQSSRPEVFLNNQPIQAEVSYDRGLIVSVKNVPVFASLRIRVGERPVLAVNDTTSLLFPVLHEAQIAYDLKKKIWATITGESYVKNHLTYGAESTTNMNQRISQLYAMDIHSKLMGALLEMMLADGRSV